MGKKEMTVKEYERMTKTPYRSNFNKVDYSPEHAFGVQDSAGYTYTGEGASNKAGAGRGGQGGPSAKQADQNRAFMSAAEKAARDSAAEMQLQERTDKAYRDASKDMGLKKGGKVSSASSRGDGIATKGKTRGTMVTMCGGGMAKKK